MWEMFKHQCRQCKEKRSYKETVRPWGICLECYQKARAKQRENRQRFSEEGILEPTVDILLISYVEPLPGYSRMIEADEADRILAVAVKE